MTDLISAPDAGTSKLPESPSAADETATAVLTPADGVASEDVAPPSDGDQPLAWAPVEPRPKRKRVGLWVGIGVGALALGAGAASLILIAPGTTVAGIPVGFMTPGAAAEAISTHLAETEITLTGAGEDIVLTGADLGAAMDARGLADEAFASRPLWNIGAWMGEPIAGEIVLDPETADSALRKAVPSSYADPVDAGVVFDAATGAYVTTPSETGTGIDIDDLTAAIADTVADGGRTLEFPGGPAEAQPAISDEDAATTAASLNTLLGSIGFYVGEERTVPIDPATAASWLTIVDEDGQLRIEADETAIQATVDALPAAVNRAPVDAATIVNSSGAVLRDEAAGQVGRALGDTSDVAADFAAQLEKGEGAFALEVEEVPFASVAIVRTIDVDLGSQTLSLLENGNVIDSWRISSGVDGWETETGNYTINWKLNSQNMGNQDLTKAPGYYQPNVKWVMYFNGDQALHGVYWHSNFGRRMSHGCVGMPEWQAKKVFDWAPQGVEISVHY
ncbi:L,D-transpeptidase family protein [Microbacterium hydrocarbonoxydans]|uniref:L,D-transpeptidase family protein n=1 Tax=Microbacterium hydrocarbonoxydans TaxID=273678 RepID=UPI001FBB555B|nr:L,D-transpeptidase family protein [Microbacterium hydrocarbonoxydans]